MLSRFISGMFLSLICLCSTATASIEFITTKQKGKSEFHFDNLKTKRAGFKLSSRSTEYPSQLFHLQVEITDPEVSLQEVIDRFDELFFHHVEENNFYSSVIGLCLSLPDHTMDCDISGFFEPADDEAVKIADKIRAEVAGVDFFGTPFKFDESKAIVFNLATNIGLGSNEPHSLFTRYSSFNRLVKFNNFYDADKQLFNIIDDLFEPTNAAKILPLVANQLGGIDEFAREALMSGNTMEIWINSIFLYKDDLKMYPILSGAGFMYYREVCGENENDTCLQPAK